MRKQLVHLKYSGQDFVYQIKRCICFDAQQCDVYDGLFGVALQKTSKIKRYLR
ncbi:MAG: hypothetical protein V7K67_11940 [Nostoc sp.]|uniref:hypothetical protein n=1 Tax=Nostoc sp. TaxID=1180 RepID=UPI002FF0E2F3